MDGCWDGCWEVRMNNMFFRMRFREMSSTAKLNVRKFLQHLISSAFEPPGQAILVFSEFSPSVYAHKQRNIRMKISYKLIRCGRLARKPDRRFSLERIIHMSDKTQLLVRPNSSGGEIAFVAMEPFVNLQGLETYPEK